MVPDLRYSLPVWLLFRPVSPMTSITREQLPVLQTTAIGPAAQPDQGAWSSWVAARLQPRAPGRLAEPHLVFFFCVFYLISARVPQSVGIIRNDSSGLQAHQKILSSELSRQAAISQRPVGASGWRDSANRSLAALQPASAPNPRPPIQERTRADSQARIFFSPSIFVSFHFISSLGDLRPVGAQTLLTLGASVLVTWVRGRRSARTEASRSFLGNTLSTKHPNGFT